MQYRLAVDRNVKFPTQLARWVHPQELVAGGRKGAWRRVREAASENYPKRNTNRVSAQQQAAAWSLPVCRLAEEH